MMCSLCMLQVYKVSQTGQETEETHLSDTLVNYSNDAVVNVLLFYFLFPMWCKAVYKYGIKWFYICILSVKLSVCKTSVQTII